MIVVCFQLLNTQLSHSYHQYLLIKTSVAVLLFRQMRVKVTECARREGSGKAGQDMLFHQVAETSNACLARVGGGGGDYYGKFFLGMYFLCLRTPTTPLYLGFDRFCSKMYIQQHNPIGLLLESTPGVSLWLMAKRELFVPT